MQFKPGDRVMLKQAAVRRGLADKIAKGDVRMVLGEDIILVMSSSNKSAMGIWKSCWWKRERKDETYHASSRSTRTGTPNIVTRRKK